MFRSACLLSSSLLLTASFAVAQATPPKSDVPSLRHRSSGNPDGAPAQTIATGHTDLSSDAEGAYPWKSRRGNGQIELYFEDGTLQGYMTEPLDAHSPNASPLTFDFVATHIEGNALTFETRRLHGAWYTFSGHLERGLVASPSQSGYYLLTGTLTEHGNADGDVGHIVSLPREPGDN